MKNRDLGCTDWKLWVQLHPFLFHWYTVLYIFKSTLQSLGTKSFISQTNLFFFPPNTAHAENSHCKKSINLSFIRHRSAIQRDVWWYNQFLPFLFTPPLRIHIAFLKNNFHKRLFHQIRSHSPFRYQDELLMCLHAADKCAKSDSTLPVSKRMPSVRQMCLSLMYSHWVQCWQRSASLNRSLAWHMSKHYDEIVQMLTSLCCKTFYHVYTRGKENHCDCILILLVLYFTLTECFSLFCLFSSFRVKSAILSVKSASGLCVLVLFVL